MAQKISSKRILADLENRRKKEERKNYTFRFNVQLYESFKTACGSRKSDLAPSNVLEALMRAFVEDAGGKVSD